MFQDKELEAERQARLILEENCRGGQETLVIERRRWTRERRQHTLQAYAEFDTFPRVLSSGPTAGSIRV